MIKKLEVFKKLSILSYFISLFITILLFPIIFFIIKLIGIFYKIRFTEIFSHRYGHLGANPHAHLIEKKEDKTKVRYLDFFCTNKIGVCNMTLLNLWKKKIIILPRCIIAPTIYLLNKIYSPLKNPHTIKNFNEKGRDLNFVWDKYKPSINLSPEQHKNCVNILLNNKIEISKIKFVCLFNRDDAYFNSFKNNKSWYYRSHQNYNIKKFNLMVDELSKRDIYTFRMGAKVEGTIGENNSKVIDYANSKFRSEVMDIFLAINCMFGISCGTGSSCVAVVHRKPLLDLNGNIYQLETNPKSNVLLSKHYYSKEKKRNLTLKELMQFNLGSLNTREQLDAAKIEVTECTQEEIKDACLELLDRTQGNWVDKNEDIILQNIFKEKYDNFKVHPKTGVRWHGDIVRSNYSSSFLRLNRDWLN
jgi:putative glycosyltransferase (TIGR04372 family)